MDIVTSIVGEDYYDNIIKNCGGEVDVLNTLLKDHTLHVISNIGEERIKELYPNNSVVVDYPYVLWNYVDKIYYSFKISKEKNTDILWVDSNKVSLYMDILTKIQPFNQIKYNGLWDVDDDILIIDDHWKPLMDVLDMDHKSILKIMEQIFYIPENISNNDLLTDILKLKGTLSHQSALKNFFYRSDKNEISIGNGEGIILGYLIEKYKIPHSSFSTVKQNLI